jgi:hypothetical protein
MLRCRENLAAGAAVAALTLAVMPCAGATPVLCISASTQTHVTVSGRPAYPSPDIACFGDSMTTLLSYWGLYALYSSQRAILMKGLDGEKSDGTLGRIQGVQLHYPPPAVNVLTNEQVLIVHSPQAWSNGQSVTLRARMPEARVMTWPSTQASWSGYFATIETATNVQFMAGNRLLAETTNAENAIVATAYASNSFRFLAPNHGLIEGTRLHFAPPSAVPTNISPWHFYYVTQASNDSFAVLFTNGAPAPLDLGSDAGPGLTAYGDFKATVIYDGTYASTDVVIRTRTPDENKTYMVWTGNNNYYEQGQLRSDLVDISRHVRAWNRQVLYLSANNNSLSNYWKGASFYHWFPEHAAWLQAAFPESNFDVRTFLVDQYNPTNAQDVLDHEHDVPAGSLRADNIHLNTAGCQLVARAIWPWLSRPTPNMVDIWNAGDGTLNYTCSSDAPWLRFFYSTGSSTGQHKTAFMDLRGDELSPGVYTGRVTVTASGAAGSPQTVTVTLLVMSNGPWRVGVVTDRGIAMPGSLDAATDATVDQSVSPDVLPGGAGVQYVCSGAAVAGQYAWLASSTNLTIPLLTNHCTIVWQWTTQFWLAASSGAGGQIGGATNGWYNAGSNVLLTATASRTNRFVGWAGDVPAGQACSKSLLLPMDRPRTVSASFEPWPPGPGTCVFCR